jgi:tetratricopeptide (TPR) repeat protein
LLANYLEGELGEEPAVIDIVRRTAEIFDHRLGQRSEAEKYYRRLFDARPDDRDVAALFEGALERWGAWQELRELIDEEAGRAVEPAAKLALLRRSAKLDEEKLDSRGRAIGTLREAMDVDPADRATAAELERLLSVEGQWHELAEHIAATLDRISDAREGDNARLRLAKILYEQLDDVAGAVDRYAEVLERTPGHPNAVAGARVAGRLGRRAVSHAVILEPVYRGSGDLGKLVGALEAELESVDDRGERVRILREMAEIPSAPRAARARVRLPRARLADRRRVGRDAGRDGDAGPGRRPPQRAGRDAGEGRRRGRRSEPAGAAVGDDRAVARGPAGPRARRDRGVAVGAVRAPRRSRRVPRARAAAVRRGALAGAGRRAGEAPRDHLRRGERKAIAKRIAVLYDDALKQREAAVRAWETVLEIDPRDADALEALALLHAAGGAYRELTDVYARKLELSDRREERRLLLAQSARIFEENLSEPDQAVDQLRKLLEETPGDAEALVALDRIFTNEGRHSDLIEVLDIRAGFAKRPQDRDELRSGRRASPRPSCPTSRRRSAVTRASWPRRPTHAGTRWRRCATIARGDDYRVPAIDALEPVLRSGAAWDQVVELLELRLAVEDAVERGWRSWARSRASTSWSGATSTARSRPGRAR